jgi:photosystem II stability/assembly factor-like uncharacterized protein
VSRLALGLALLVGFGSGGTSVPTGFEPLSFTAVSRSDFWLLGTVPCRVGRCAAIVRTTDGGRTFAAVGAPALPTSVNTPELRFADRRDGFAFVPWRGLFYATHDGGATWRRLGLGRVVGFGTGAGRVFVVTTRRLLTSPVSADAWSGRALPFPSDGSALNLAAHGPTVWLLGTRPSRGPMSRDELARSSDAGRTFATMAGPCVPGLGGALAPTSARVVWAVCPTGMSAAAWRSVDGGVAFARLPTPPLVNSAQIAPASATTAVLVRGFESRLLRTTDGGETWRAPRTPGHATGVLWAGFTDARVGSALVQTHGQETALWRTTDGGATWSAVPVR